MNPYYVKQVIVIRRDLKMRRGKEIAQGAHASMKVFFDRLLSESPSSPGGEEGFSFTSNADWNWEAIKQWVEGSFAKICVRVDSEEELLELKQKAEGSGICCALIEDEGRTEFNGVTTRTALAIGPDFSEHIDPITGHLKLL